MSNEKRSPGLRLEVNHEASALISIWGSRAHSIALQRAEEASSEQLVNDWDSVALAIVRQSGTRPSLLSHLFD
jgi:hypothetical protein